MPSAWLPYLCRIDIGLIQSRSKMSSWSGLVVVRQGANTDEGCIDSAVHLSISCDESVTGA
jgi:hypothetical protein